MNRLFTGAALVWAGTAVLLAQTGSGTRAPSGGPSPVAPKAAAVIKRSAAASPAATQSAAPAAAQSPALAAEATKYRAWLNKNCVGCHNSRTAAPPESPVNLESASLDDVLPQAETWERVLRKLGARAMPPQGVPHPAETEYVGFTTWLAGSLDRAWEGRNTPGRYVMHRLNRSEYANVVRDLLGLDIDVSEWLPSDGGDFGFDNNAASLKTSPLLLERYVAAAQRISTLAVGDRDVRPGTTEYTISREFTQSGYIDGLPLGTRGGTVIRHVFPADAEYKLSGRLVRGVEEGYAGVEGNDQPATFIITVDGAEVYSAQIGGPKDHDVQAKDMNEAKALIDARMTGRVAVTAGPHDVGFTWKERAFERQDVWQPARRDSQEVHMIAGLPRLKTVGVEGPYNVKGVSNTPGRERLFVCHPASAAEEQACAVKILSNLARRAYRRPVTPADVEAPLGFYKQMRENGRDFDAGIRSGVARILSSPSFLYRIERDPASVRPGAAHAVSDHELASRRSF
jgi:mono/diheme cytochrome c family protein